MLKPIRRVGVIGAGVMGSGIAAHLANAGVHAILLDIVPPDLTEAEKSDRAARNRFAATGLDKAVKARPAAFFHPSFARLVGDRQHRGRPRQARRLRPGHRGHHREARAQARALRAARGRRARGHHRLQHLGPAHRRHGGGPLRGLQEALPRDALLQPRPLHEAPRAGHRAATPTERALARVRRLGEDVLGKGVVVGKDTPNFIGNRIGTHAMMAAIHQMITDGLAPGGRRRHHRPRHGPPQERQLPHRRHRRHRHHGPRRRQLLRRAHQGRGARGLRGAELHPRHGREADPRRQDQRRLLQEGQGRRDRDLRPGQARVPPQGRRRGHQEGRQEHREDRGPGRAGEEARRRSGQGRGVRVEGDLALARLLRAPHGRDRRQHRGHRRGHALGLQLGARPLRDLGRPRLRRDRRPDGEGRPRAAPRRSRPCAPRARPRSTRAGRSSICSRASTSTTASDPRAATLTVLRQRRQAGARQRRRGGVGSRRRRPRAHLQDQGEQPRRATSSACSARRSRRPSRISARW